MNKTMKIFVVVSLIIAIGIVIAIKQKETAQTPNPPAEANPESVVSSESVPDDSQNSPQAENLPKLIDLGADKCIPCKAMAPILENLREEFRDTLDVVFIDVWKNPDQAKTYNINLIPTQIFFDSSGKELFRHEGFYSKEDILAKWKELGIKLETEKQ